MSLPVSATEGIVTFVASVLLLLKELLFLLAGDSQTLGNQELANEPVTDDRGGLAPVWELELEFGLNHLAEVPQLMVNVWDAFDYDAVPRFAV